MPVPAIKSSQKKTLPDEFTRLTGCHRKSTVGLLSASPVREVVVYQGGKLAKLKPEKKRFAGRMGKRVYAEDVSAFLRLVWTFFWYKRAGNEVSVKSAPPYAAKDAMRLKGKIGSGKRSKAPRSAATF